MKGLNLTGFKKIKEDAQTATMVHKEGHQITISKRSLGPLQKTQLEKLPLYRADGGEISDYSSDDEGNATPAPAPQAPAPASVAPDMGSGYGADDQAQPQAQAAPDMSQASDADSQAPQAQQYQAPAQAQTQATDDTAASMAKPATPGGADSITPESIYGNEIAGLKGQAAAQGQMYQDQAKDEQQHQQDLQVAQAGWQERQSGMLNDISSALDDVKNGHIDPKHYMENMGTEQKVATGIGLFLGGWSTAYTHGSNPAMDFLNKQIDRDIESQKSNQANKVNVYNGYLDKYKNASVAENMTRATELGIYASKIREAAAKAGTPLAAANAKVAIAQAQEKILPLVQHANFLKQTQEINQVAQGTGKQSPIDPSKLVPFSNAPPAEQEKMFEEIKNAQNINNIRQPSLQAFDQAAKEVRPTTGGAHTSLTAFVPGMESPGQKAWAGLANTTVKEIEGTARKAAMDSIAKNYMPQFGDDQSTINQKRQNWQTYLASQSAAPVAAGHWINLQNYQSTATNLPGRSDAPVKGADGRMYVKQGNYMVPVK